MNLPKEIRSFSGDWIFLSNFYPVSIALDGVTYGSVEHAYQAAKTLDPKQREKFSYVGVSASQAKRMGKSLQLRSDWEEVKVSIMRDLLLQKFYPTILRRKLLCTFTAQLIEGNYWHDTWYGVCEGTCKQGPHEPKGENVLGKLLMEIRDYYSKG
jgi:ribA/ribD-fused uncharacterized protein